MSERAPAFKLIDSWENKKWKGLW